MTQVTVSIPDDLAQRARNAGLLSDKGIQIEDAIRRQAGERLRELMDRTQREVLTPEIEQMMVDEVCAYRAEHRKAQDLMQAQLGELVGVTQQQIASFEIGRRRIPVSTLPLLAKALGVGIETLIDGKHKTTGKRGPAPKIQQQLERVSTLPKSDQRAVMRVLDSMLAQAGR